MLGYLYSLKPCANARLAPPRLQGTYPQRVMREKLPLLSVPARCGKGLRKRLAGLVVSLDLVLPFCLHQSPSPNALFPCQADCRYQPRPWKIPMRAAAESSDHSRPRRCAVCTVHKSRWFLAQCSAQVILYLSTRRVVGSSCISVTVQRSLAATYHIATASTS